MNNPRLGGLIHCGYKSCGRDLSRSIILARLGLQKFFLQGLDASFCGAIAESQALSLASGLDGRFSVGHGDM